MEWDANNPLFEWNVQRVDSSGGVWEEVSVAVDHDECLSHEFVGVNAGDSFLVWWENVGGGSSLSLSNRVHAAVEPPAGCPAGTLSPLVDWDHDTSLSEPQVEEVYDCVTGYFAGTSNPCGT